jgi:phosphate/sulfate permease
MTWLAVLAWAAAYVVLALLVGMLLGIRRELEDVGRELNLTLHRVEEIQVELVEVRLQVHAMRGEVAAMVTAMERKGILK